MFVDDEELTEDSPLEIAAGDFNAPTEGGLFVAGIPRLIGFGVEKAAMAKTTAGFRGNIRDIVFINDE